MIRFAYLATLLASLFCLGMIDFRYRLAWFHNRRRTARTLLLSVVLFSVWDMCGIGLGIFFVGPSRYITGVRLLHEFPVEEIFFLLLLNYTALLAWRGWEVRCSPM